MDKSPLTPSHLEASLRALAREDCSNGASAAVRTRLLQEVVALRAARRRTIVKTSLLMTVLSVATGVAIWQVTTAGRHPDPTRSAMTVAGRELVTAFYPLEYSAVPMTGGRLIRMEVSPSALAAFGVSETTELPERSAPTKLLADVLVGEDGLARAVRFVRPREVGSGKDSR